MHSSMAFVNGAGIPAGMAAESPDLTMLNTLLASAGSVAAAQEQPALDKTKSKDEHQAEKELGEETVSKPGGFDNDPDVPTNPNEVRERHLKKLKP